MTIDKLNELRTSQEHSRSWKLFIFINFILTFIELILMYLYIFYLYIYKYDFYFYMYFVLTNITITLFILTFFKKNILTLKYISTYYYICNFEIREE